jgi:hypothetical protein
MSAAIEKRQKGIHLEWSPRRGESTSRYAPSQVAFPALAGNLAPGPGLGPKPVFSRRERRNIPREP